MSDMALLVMKKDGEGKFDGDEKKEMLRNHKMRRRIKIDKTRMNN